MNYPDLDLRFSNDTGHWLLLRTFVGAGSLTVNLYGTPVDRRVESTTAPLEVTGPVPVKETDDPTLEKGKRVVDEVGSPPRQTSVQRLVYDADGKLLYDNTWRSFYVGEPSLVRVGTKEPEEAGQAEEAAKSRPTPPVSRLADGATSPIPRSRLPLGRSDRLDGTTAERASAAASSRRPSRGASRRRHELSCPLDPVLVAEPRSAHVDAAEVDREDVVEERRGVVVDPHAGRERLDALRLDRAVAARVVGEVRDPRHLEPDDERGVMGDALRVRLGEPHADVVGVPEAVRHSATIEPGFRRRRCSGMTGAMSEATKTSKDDRDVIARLAERGEQTIARLADLPGGTKALQAVNDLRARVDELGKKVRGIDALEQRVAKLEKELAALKRAQKQAKAAPKPPPR